MSADTLERLRDLTDRLIETQPAMLVEGDAMLVSIAEHDVIIVAQTDEFGALVIRYASGGAYELFGYDEGEMLSLAVTRLIPRAIRPRHEAGVRRYIDTGESAVIGRYVRGPGVRKDGTIVPLVIFIRLAQPPLTSIPATFVATIRDEREAIVIT